MSIELCRTCQNLFDPDTQDIAEYEPESKCDSCVQNELDKEAK